MKVNLSIEIDTEKAEDLELIDRLISLLEHYKQYIEANDD